MAGRIVKDMPNADYHASEGVSKSGLDKIARSPAHYKSMEFKEPTRAMAIGTAVHAAILEPERFSGDYFFTGCRDRVKPLYKRAKKRLNKAGVADEFILTWPETKKVHGVRRAIENNPLAMQELNKEGDAELSMFCTDPETGIQIRARFDWVNCDRNGVDVKKTQDLRKFGRSVEDYRYNVQEAMYSFIYEQVTGEPLDNFYFLAIEEEKPHSNEMFLLSDFHREIGAYYFRRDLRVYADCIDSGKWPHLSHELTIEPSGYLERQYENDESNDLMSGFII